MTDYPFHFEARPAPSWQRPSPNARRASPQPAVRPQFTAALAVAAFLFVILF